MKKQSTKSVRIGKLYDMEFLALKGLPEKDKIYIGNPVQLVETYNSNGEILDIELRKADGATLIPTPRFINEYKERLKNFGKVLVFMEPHTMINDLETEEGE